MIKDKNIYYKIYEMILMSTTLIFLFFIYFDFPLPSDYYPVHEDTINAIKAVDPLEYFKDSDTHKDFVEF